MPPKPTVYEFIPSWGNSATRRSATMVVSRPREASGVRSLITVGDAGCACMEPMNAGPHERALEHRAWETELKGLITHVAFYAGWPCAVNAGRIAIDVFGPK